MKPGTLPSPPVRSPPGPVRSPNRNLQSRLAKSKHSLPSIDLSADNPFVNHAKLDAGPCLLRSPTSADSHSVGVLLNSFTESSPNHLTAALQAPRSQGQAPNPPANTVTLPDQGREISKEAARTGPSRLRSSARAGVRSVSMLLILVTTNSNCVPATADFPPPRTGCSTDS